MKAVTLSFILPLISMLGLGHHGHEPGEGGVGGVALSGR